MTPAWILVHQAEEEPPVLTVDAFDGDHDGGAGRVLRKLSPRRTGQSAVQRVGRWQRM